MDHPSRHDALPARALATRNGGDVGGDALVFVALDGTIVSWDHRARELFGRRPDEVLGLPFWALFTADCRDAIDRLASAAQSDPVRVVATAADCDGMHLELEVTSSRTLAVRDGAAGFVEAVRDITERSAVEAAIAACSGRSSSELAVAGLREALSRWIPGAKLTAATIKDADGPSHPSIMSGGHAVLLRLASEGRVFGTLSVDFGEAQVATPRIVALLAAVAEAVAPLLWRTFELEEISRSVWRLHEIDRLEKEFLALITHDMRTPLTVINGFASTLRENWDRLSERDRRDALEAIVRNGRSLTRLVEQDMDLALIDTGRLSYEIATFDLADQLQRVVDDFVSTTGARFALNVDPPLPPVRGDEARNHQILANLLSNAAKFSPAAAPIEITAAASGEMVQVNVRDHGRGISVGDRRKLFRKFSRAGSADAQAVPGTGLGLYLSKCMVEAQGGRIWVDSRPGEGSTFSYTLPAAA